MLHSIKKSIKTRLKRTLRLQELPGREELLWQALFTGTGTKRDLRIVDIGSHYGTFVDHASEAGSVAAAVLVEPQPDKAASLREKFRGPRFQVVEAAVSNFTGISEFNVLGWDQSSSLCTPKPDVSGIGKLFDFSIKQTLKVETDTLDNLLAGFIKERPIDILKLDTQGAERQAIEGAENVLARTKVVVCEVPIKATYESSASMFEIAALLEQHGFILIDLMGNTRAEHGELIECDAIFKNTRLR